VISVAVLVALAGITASLSTVSADGRMTVAAVLSAAVVVSFAAVGAVVASARPGNRVGWLMLGGAVLWAVGNAGTDLAYRGLVAAPGSIPGASAWAVAGSALRAAGWVVVTIGIPLMFPTGHSAGPRWRWLGWVAVLAAGLLAAGTLVAADANVTDLGDWHNPLSNTTLNHVGGLCSMLGMAAASVGLVGAVLSLVHRWRRADALGRQQLRLFGLAAVLPIVTLPVAIGAADGGWLFSAASLPLPIAIGFAVLARGLYDLRSAANRTIVWVTLSVVIVALYALVIAGVGSLVHARGAAWLPWLAAAVVAVCFSPLRDVLQRGVNRLTFGRWDEPYAVLADIGQRLEGTTDVDRLLDDLVRELQEGLGLEAVTIRDEAGRTVAGAAEPDADSTTLLLTAYGRIVGTLSYKPGEAALRGRDLRLLDDLAAHLGGLLHARDLTTDLERARERLVLAREEERRRLRRDLHDGLGPALAGHILRLDLIGREVAPSSSADAQVAILRDELQATVADFRKVVEGLRPPALDDLGLAEATGQMIRRVTAGSVAHLDVRIDDLPQLPAAVEVAIYRITAEAVTNAVRHAGAACVTVTIAMAPARVTIEISDDGSGLDGAAASGNGLETMRERAEELRGSLRVASSAAGTTVTAELPRPATPAETGERRALAAGTT
jgi:signal transduction histidine kinase